MFKTDKVSYQDFTPSMKMKLLKALLVNLKLQNWYEGWLESFETNIYDVIVCHMETYHLISVGHDTRGDRKVLRQTFMMLLSAIWKHTISFLLDMMP